MSLRLGATIGELKRRMSVREFAQWKRYAAEYPFDDESVHQTHVALLAALYANANRERGTTPKSLSDFMLYRQARERAEPEAEVDLDFKFRVALSRYITPDPPSPA